MKALHKISLLFIIGLFIMVLSQNATAQAKGSHQTSSLKINKAAKLSPIPQRDSKVSAPKVAPPKSSRPDRELDRPRETAPKIKEPKISKPEKVVKKPRKQVTTPKPPRKPS